MVQWLELRASTAVAGVPPLVGELRSHKPQGVAKKKKKSQLSVSTLIRKGPKEGMSLVMKPGKLILFTGHIKCSAEKDQLYLLKYFFSIY